MLRKSRQVSTCKICQIVPTSPTITDLQTARRLVMSDLTITKNWIGAFPDSTSTALDVAHGAPPSLWVLGYEWSLRTIESSNSENLDSDLIGPVVVSGGRQV
jgi:hypothetical protein